MGILVDKNTRVLMQGITGRAGSWVTKMMLDYGTKVEAGVTPGKGGESVHGVPVYDTIEEAMAAHPKINCASVYVPAAGAKEATLEAIAAGIPLIHVFTEKMQIHDVAQILAAAKMKGVRVVGPSSIGIISAGEAKVGSIGGENPDETFKRGDIGVISKSGGMASELGWLLKQAGLGISTAVGIGGDVLIGSDFADLLELFEKDKDTKAVVIFGEIGGTYEERAAELIAKRRFTKPLIAYVSGKFAETINLGTPLGHAGAIIEGGRGTRDAKIAALKSAGALIAKVPDEIPELVKKAI